MFLSVQDNWDHSQHAEGMSLTRAEEAAAAALAQSPDSQAAAALTQQQGPDAQAAGAQQQAPDAQLAAAQEGPDAQAEGALAAPTELTAAQVVSVPVPSAEPLAASAVSPLVPPAVEPPMLDATAAARSEYRAELSAASRRYSDGDGRIDGSDATKREHIAQVLQEAESWLQGISSHTPTETILNVFSSDGDEAGPLRVLAEGVVSGQQSANTSSPEGLMGTPAVAVITAALPEGTRSSPPMAAVAAVQAASVQPRLIASPSEEELTRPLVFTPLMVRRPASRAAAKGRRPLASADQRGGRAPLAAAGGLSGGKASDSASLITGNSASDGLAPPTGQEGAVRAAPPFLGAAVPLSSPPSLSAQPSSASAVSSQGPGEIALATPTPPSAVGNPSDASPTPSRSSEVERVLEKASRMKQMQQE